MQYIKKPIIVEAFHLGYEKLPEWFVDKVKIMDILCDIHPYAPHMSTFRIKTLEGTMTANPGDMVIKGIQGEIYPCKKDIFDASYDPYIYKPSVEYLDD